MEKAKAKTKAKRKGGAEKLRARKKQALRADVAACVKITDMFSTGQVQVHIQHPWPILVVRKMMRGREIRASGEREENSR